MAADDELIFTIPLEKLDDLMLGLRRIDETGSKLPMTRRVRPEPELPESYIKIGKMLGMEVG